MRVLQLSVPDEDREPILAVIEEEGLGYTVARGAGPQEGTSVVTIAVPADAVEHVLADLEDAGFAQDAFTASLDAEFARFEGVDEVQNRWGSTPNRLAPAALRAKAKDLRRNMRSFLWMMVLSAVVASAGLLVGSPAVVVGSMVIAPIVSPVLTAGVGAVRDDRDMLVESLHMQGVGLGVAVLTATVVGFLVQALDVVPSLLAIGQMRLLELRISPSMLAVAIGLAAGAAGAFGLATKGQVTIVGVMIAAALIPTAAAVGIGIAWGRTAIALGALLLLVVSMIGINVGAASMLFYLDYRPDRVDEPIFSFDDARKAARVVATLALAAALVLVAGLAFAHQSAFERSVNAAVTDVLASEGGEGPIEQITVEYRAPLATDRTQVTVAVARTTPDAFPNLADEIDRAITDRTGLDVLVQVRFVDYESSEEATDVGPEPASAA